MSAGAAQPAPGSDVHVVEDLQVVGEELDRGTNTERPPWAAISGISSAKSGFTSRSSCPRVTGDIARGPSVYRHESHLPGDVQQAQIGQELRCRIRSQPGKARGQRLSSSATSPIWEPPATPATATHRPRTTRRWTSITPTLGALSRN